MVFIDYNRKFTIGTYRYFDNIFRNIYPSELELNATASSVHNTTYLDMNISIADGKFVHKLYDNAIKDNRC